jgi:hypothetical protein
MGKKKRGRPCKSPDEVRVHMSNRVLPATFDALNKIAEQSGESRSEVLDRLIVKEYKRVTK